MTVQYVPNDPTSKQHIETTLCNFLYGPHWQRLNDILVGLITRNSVIQRNSHRSFTYKGDDYSLDALPLPRPRHRLDPSLEDTMKDYLRKKEEISSDEFNYVFGFIKQGLNTSDQLADYYRVFPEVLHKPLQQFYDFDSKAKLPEDFVLQFHAKNEKVISLIKQRVLLNLVI